MAQPAMQPAASAPAPPAFRPQALRSVRMHPRLAAGVGGFVFLVLLGYGLTRKPVYSAEALVYEEPAAAKLMSDGTAGGFDSARYESYLDQQKQVMARPDVLGAAVASLPPQTWRVLGPNARAAQQSLATQLKVDRVKTSYQLSVSLQSSDPAAAAAIVNAVTAAYLKEVHQDAAAQSDQRAQLLGEERRRIEGELETTRTEQAGLSASLGVASPLGENGNPYDFELASVRQELLTARQAHDAAAAQLGSLSGGGQDAALATAADEIMGGDTGLASMRATVSARRATLNGQMAGMKPENPVYKQDLEELSDLDKTLDTMTRQTRAKAENHVQEKLRTELERSGDVESRLNAQLAQLTAKATTAAPRLQRAAELNDDLQRLNIRFAAVDDALRSLQLEANGPGIVRLSLAAAVPTTPEPSRKMLLLAAAPLLGLICGIAAAVMARKRDRRLYSGRDVEDVLGFAPMAVLPARADVSLRVMDEYVLRLAAGIESAYRDGGAQTFLLTAVSASTQTRLLRKALIARLKRIGLDVALARPTDLLLAEQRGKLSGGRREISRTGDGFVAEHLAKLKGEHALVVIDAPALGTSAETEYVARCADATILVAECGVTTREELLQSGQLLQRLHARGVGAVLAELQLRFADQSFRDAIDAFERRQPEQSASAERSAVRSAARAAAAPVEEEGETDYVLPREYIAVKSSVETVEESQEPLREIEAAAEPVVEMDVEASPMEAAPDAPVVQAAAEEEALPIVSREPLPHEKMSPTLSVAGEQTSDGEQPMTAPRSWFHRFVRRDGEKVSLLSERGEDAASVDEASFLESRISHSRNAYPAAAPHEVDAFGAEVEPAMSRQYVLDDLQTIQNEHGELRGDEHKIPVLAAIGSIANGMDFERVEELQAPSGVREPEVAAPALPAAEIADKEFVVRARPARPLSFHELAALAAGSETVHAAEPVGVAFEAESEAADEMVHTVEVPAELMQAHAAVLPVEQVQEVMEALPMPVAAKVEHVAEPMVAQEIAQTVEAQRGPEIVAAPRPETPFDFDAEEREDALPHAFTTPAGTSRWDPIPPLRPTDSGWNRMYGANGANGGNGSDGNGSDGSNGVGAAVRGRGDDWSDRGDGIRPELAVPPRQEKEVGGELDEPALSRPWGLLSRFQQTHLIAPARKNGLGKLASANGHGGHDEYDRNAASDKFQDPFQAGRKG